ncbi:15860_t:CDS:2 [Rhizophagus irregularis]|nr:15860_t:CDS:2 [Rhizophagus irregularis]
MTLNDMVSFPQLIASATSKTTLPDETRDPLLTKMESKKCKDFYHRKSEINELQIEKYRAISEIKQHEQTNTNHLESIQSKSTSRNYRFD